MTDSLAIFTRASAMLAEADTLQKAKELKDLALTAAEWARRKNMGDEAILHCRSYAFEAERKIGQMLKMSPKAKGARAGGKKDSSRGHYTQPRDSEPTLADVGLSKRDSADAQVLAEVDADVFERLKAGKITRATALNTVRSEKSERNLKRRREAVAPRRDERVIVGDFREKGDQIADGSVAMIFTDPPYDKEASKLFPALAQFAERVLCDGGSIVFYSGHLQLPAAFAAFTNLRHWWTCANIYDQSGGKAMMREYGVRVCWKPLLWFVKLTRENKRDFVTDVNITARPEKGWHEWQQTVEDAKHWIGSICPKGGLVCDTFLGGGTTAIAAQQLGLEWFAFEQDAVTASMAIERIAHANTAS